MTDKTLLAMGRITKAHGIRGEVCVNFYADSPRVLNGELYLAPPETALSASTNARPNARSEQTLRPVKAASIRMDHAHLLIRFEGINDRTEAEKLRGLDLLVPEASLPPLEEGEAYLHELPGLAVFVLEEDGTESELGTIQSVSSPAGQELWTITPLAALADGRKNAEILFPAVPEFVHAIDLSRRRVVICPPPGLLELYL